MTKYRQYALTATLFCALFLGSCAVVQDSADAVGSVFKGNTKRNPRNYGLEDKVEYRKYRNEKKLRDEHNEEVILEHMERTK